MNPFSAFSVLRSKSVVAALVLAGASLLAAPASADVFAVQYFQVPTPQGSTPAGSDFYCSGCSALGVSNDYVLSSLGADGLPVYNQKFTTASGTVNPAYEVNGAGELEWWTPSAATGVTATGSGPLDVPSTGISMYPPNSLGADDGTYLETAILTGSFSLASQSNVSFQVGADDDAFVYVDNDLVLALGGIHGDTLTSTDTLNLAAGNHTIQIFYADQMPTGSELSFYDNAVPVTAPPAATPEPGSMTLLGTGLLAVSGMVRRRLKR